MSKGQGKHHLGSKAKAASTAASWLSPWVKCGSTSQILRQTHGPSSHTPLPQEPAPEPASQHPPQADPPSAWPSPQPFFPTRKSIWFLTPNSFCHSILWCGSMQLHSTHTFIMCIFFHCYSTASLRRHPSSVHLCQLPYDSPAQYTIL